MAISAQNTATHSSHPRPVGVVGLGLVGCALASRLKLAGYSCLGFDLNPEAMARFGAKGYQTAISLNELTMQVDTFVLTVFDTNGVLQVVEKILHGQSAPTDSQYSMPLGKLTLIDCSTGDPELLGVLSVRLKKIGIQFIEAPLSGSSHQIEEGEATMLLGGEVADIQSADTLLSALANTKIHVGPAGMGARAKLATNLVLGLNRAALAEGMVFAESIGIPPASFLQLVLATPARSEAAMVKGAMMVNKQYEPQSRIRQHLKDVKLMLGMAQHAGQNLPLSQVHSDLMHKAIEAGDGELDNAAIVEQIRREKL
jgi:3-hydroxyisobutyrate dehydrogenase-like beta-hydroxyacid dehydrogenase